jgi:hypothetical protein
MHTHNLISNVMIDGTIKVDPQIGMGATVCGYSDRHACTVIGIDQPRGLVHLRQDTATRSDSYGISDTQDYDYKPNPEGREYSFKYFPNKNKWFEVVYNPKTKRFNKSGSMGLILGQRDEYYDFSF